jgi:hypothetical protein
MRKDVYFLEGKKIFLGTGIYRQWSMVTGQ